MCKFRGAGQGPLALVAEVIGGELARSLGLPVPELVRMEVDPVLADAEPDPEIQELLQASAGLNLGVDYLPGSLAFDASVAVDPDWAAKVVWLDHLITNVDRTPRNPNLLCWHGDVWVIDHGAALYRQHGTDDFAAEAAKPFATDHVLAPFAGPAPTGLEPDLDVVDLVPDEWLSARRARPIALSWSGGWMAEAFSYTVLQVVPRVERGERMNAGVVLFCRRRRFLAARVELDAERLTALDPTADAEALRRHLEALAAVAAGEGGDSVAQLEQSERFHWLAAPASTVVQPAPVHTGLTDDPAATLERLFAELVA